MKMDRRLSNGLAWAGALLVIGIPAADYLTGTFANNGAPSLALVDADPVAPPETAAVVPPAAAKPVEQAAEAPEPVPAAGSQAVAATSDPVQGFLQSGKELPSYITGGGVPTAAAPAQPPAKPATVPVAPKPAQAVATPAPAPAVAPQPTEQVAALPPKVAPTPMPLSMRPRQASVPPVNNQPLIIDEVAARPVAPPQQSSDFVTAEDLKDWESGPLNEFLARRNQQSSATYRVQQNVPAYSPGGFWLDEGPQGDRPIGRYPRTDDDVYYLPF